MRGVALRPKACAECYRRRAKCVFVPDTESCTRCAKLGKRCRPRMLRREATDSREAMEKLTATAMIQLTAQGKSEQEHLDGAIHLGKLFALLGHSEAPQALRYMACSMMLVAVRAGITERLHAASSAAIAWGTQLPLNYLRAPPRATKPEVLAALTEYVEARCLVSPEEGACFVYRIDCGKCDVHANSTFEECFLSLQTLVDKLAAGGSLLFDSWHVFVTNQEAAHSFLTQLILRSIAAPPLPRCQGAVGWRHATSLRVELVDRRGRRLTAQLGAAGAATETCCVLGVAIRDLHIFEDQSSSTWSPSSVLDAWSTAVDEPNNPDELAIPGAASPAGEPPSASAAHNNNATYM